VLVANPVNLPAVTVPRLTLSIATACPGDQHLGFGGGIHYYVGAPLARIEAHIALGALARRLVGPRLVTDPPPYRDNASLRGPEHLFVEFDGMR
jgi:cytochrome P450